MRLRCGCERERLEFCKEADGLKREVARKVIEGMQTGKWHMWETVQKFEEHFREGAERGRKIVVMGEE